jgi:hypothetical protein
VFDMIAPDGTVFPHHHRYVRVEPHKRSGYMLLWGKNGLKHADAWVDFSKVIGGTEVTLGRAMAMVKKGARALGLRFWACKRLATWPALLVRAKDLVDLPSTLGLDLVRPRGGQAAPLFLAAGV